MSATTNIEWTDKTWNVVVGCKKVSPGCKNCYAETMAKRLKAMGRPEYQQVVNEHGWNGKFVELPDRLAEPLKWRKPARVFVNSMSDLFGEGVSFEFIAAVFGVMAACPQHTFQILTKRPERAVEFFKWLKSKGGLGCYLRGAPDVREKQRDYFNHVAKTAVDRNGKVHRGDDDPWMKVLNAVACNMRNCSPFNVWLGVSIENQETADVRIPLLLQCPAAIRFVSYEPALGPVDFSKWVGYYPRHEQINRQNRGVRIRGGEGRDLRDNEDGGGLAEGAAQESGFDHQQRIPHGENHAMPEASDNDGASAGILALQRPDSAGADNQPQERRAARQQAGESRGDDIRRADAPCDSNSRQKAEGSERREERYGQAHREGSSGNQTPQIGRRAAQNDSDRLLGERPDDFQNRTRRTMGLDQIIVGGESGPGARPCDIAHIRSIVGQCKAAGVPVFVKQVGSNPFDAPPYLGGEPRLSGVIVNNVLTFKLKDRKGGDPAEWPEDLRVREYPGVRT